MTLAFQVSYREERKGREEREVKPPWAIRIFE